MNESCTAIQRLLSEQLDGRLTPDDSARLRAHLATCSNCRTFERDLRDGLAGIARLPRVSGSTEVRNAVLAGVHPGGHSAWPRGWRGWTSQTMKLTGAVVAFAIVAVVLITVFSSSDDGSPDGRFSGTGSQPEATSEPTATFQPEPTQTAALPGQQPCHPDQVAYEIVVDAMPGDSPYNLPPFARIGVHALKSTGGVQCRLTVPISLSITGTDGTPLEIQGNPATSTLDAILGGGDTRVEFAWQNWCGYQGPITITVQNLTSSNSKPVAEQPTQIVPFCVDVEQQSTLQLIN